MTSLSHDSTQVQPAPTVMNGNPQHTLNNPNNPNNPTLFSSTTIPISPSTSISPQTPVKQDTAAVATSEEPSPHDEAAAGLVTLSNSPKRKRSAEPTHQQPCKKLQLNSPSPDNTSESQHKHEQAILDVGEMDLCEAVLQLDSNALISFLRLEASIGLNNASSSSSSSSSAHSKRSGNLPSNSGNAHVMDASSALSNHAGSHSKARGRASSYPDMDMGIDPDDNSDEANEDSHELRLQQQYNNPSNPNSSTKRVSPSSSSASQANRNPQKRNKSKSPKTRPRANSDISNNPNNPHQGLIALSQMHPPHTMETSRRPRSNKPEEQPE